jgi:hypothetical protein
MRGMDDTTVEEPLAWEWPIGAGADYVLRKQHELTRLLAERLPVFLDTRYWIWARQAATGESDDPELISLLGALRLGVQSGKLFFPVTNDLIAEFSKQPPDLLADTMMMVDLLSLGVALVPHHERTVIEMEGFTARCWPDHPPTPRPIWTCYAFALGYQDLRPEGVEINDSLLIKMADAAWMAPPSFLAAHASPNIFDAKAESERIAAYLNEQEELHAHQIDRHEAAVSIEIGSTASLIAGIAAREVRRLALASGHDAEARDLAGSQRTGQHIARMIADGLKQDQNRRSLGSLFVPAMLHAAVRSEAERKIKPNDIFDFRHAAAALPYCRAFFTEGPLRTLVTSGHMRLDKLYGCLVVSEPGEAMAVIKDLVLGSA